MTEPTPHKAGFAPEVVAVLAYVGGAITGIAVLVYEKEDRFVRFHAMQSTVTFLLVLAAQLALSGLPMVGKFLYVPFFVGVVALWIFLMYQAFHKRSYKLPFIGEFAEHQLR